MKIPFRREHAVALVIVLTLVALLAAVILAYFWTTSGAVASAGNFQNSVRSQQLAEMALNVVKGQITDGTRTRKKGAAQADESADLLWTSQPGLIRSYDTDGNPYRFYKLYSSDEMHVERFDDGYWSPEEHAPAEVPDDWKSEPALFTDLNEPSLLPHDESAPVPADAIFVDGRPHFAHYPIIDPSATSSGIEGFSFDSSRVSAVKGTLSRGYDPTGENSDGCSRNPVPMPVRWLYVLRDGQLTVPARTLTKNGGYCEAHWAPDASGSPSRDNPIVGRIAFWADDECCKLNVNTASEGVYWDRPSGKGSGSGPFDEWTFAVGIPRRDEWQRTPGHPAMTCLSPVFGILPDFRVPRNHTRADYAKFAAYYELIPRVGDGGTEAGTMLREINAIRPDMDRLFASADETAFSPRVNVNGRVRSNPMITGEFLEKARFFLTASSKAPETNAFNLPRVSMWPVQQERDPNHGKPGCPERPRSPQDDQMARCATLGGKPYFFQRYSVYMSGDVNDRSKHPNEPFAQQGEFLPPSSQRTDLDWKIPRNHELYRYLQSLTARKIPGIGMGSSFSSKLDGGRDQLLTSMVDFLRTANGKSPRTSSNEGFDYVPPQRIQRGWINLGAAQITPLVPPPGTPGEGTKGIGRFPTITEMAFVLYQTRPGELAAMLAFQPFAPTAGPPTWLPLVRVCIRGMESFSINGKSLDMPPLATNLYAPPQWCPHGTQAFNCPLAMHEYQLNGGLKSKTAGLASEERNYPFCSRALVPISKDEAVSFSGGKLKVEIHTGYEGSPRPATTAPPPETLVQTLELEFPPAVLPVPPARSTTPDVRISSRIVYGGEVVRSVQIDPDGPTKGDLRLLALLPKVPANYFRPHPDYRNSKIISAHSLRAYGGLMANGTNYVELIPGANDRYGIAANGLRGAMLAGGNASGDWDNGVGGHSPGGQFGRPDEGNSRSSAGGYYDQTFTPEDGTTWSPLRQLPSPVAFGSLPVGAIGGKPQPWRTPLFCANPAAGKYHPGWESPRDHYLLDLFHMPVVEPWAISEPLATAGKVNLNYQLVPFTYIKRDTALRGVLRGTRLPARDVEGTTKRFTIDETETLKGFEHRFANRGGCFKTASELCEMFLVPEGATLKDMADGDPSRWWWARYKPTGDNLREQPYGHIYPRVTSRSNTFAVHYRVQLLASGNAREPHVWSEMPGGILYDQRGCTVIERYIAPTDSTLPDVALNSRYALDSHYKFRVVRQQTFRR